MGHPTVIKLSLLTWGCSIVLGFILALAKQRRRAAGCIHPSPAVYLVISQHAASDPLIFVYNMPQALPPSPRC
ncbi:hypothetical protein MJ579_13200 [Klebsiella pneumoniae]|nr:hypothetical protein MJ579_13200 [Klebsiella pneumoniae]